MSNIAEQDQVQAGTSNESESGSLLEQAIVATKQTERTQAELLLKTFTENALKGTVSFDKNLVATITKAIESIDEVISEQLAK